MSHDDLSTEAAVQVHDRALCESDDVGEGTRIWAFAHVMRGATIGRDCNICEGVFVEEGVRIGNRVTVKNGALLFEKVWIHDAVFVGPGTVFTNDLSPRIGFKKDKGAYLPTRVMQGATIGANSTIIGGVTIGERAFVGAGSVVTRDVWPHALVVGTPARHVGWACECGLTLPKSLRCSCERTYRLEPTDPMQLVATTSTQGPRQE